MPLLTLAPFNCTVAVTGARFRLPGDLGVASGACAGGRRLERGDGAVFLALLLSLGLLDHRRYKERKDNITLACMIIDMQCTYLILDEAAEAI